jgi:hypothetical protein
MKLLVLGTSNSILLGGWVSGLLAALPGAQIDNLSVGASPGTQFGCHMRGTFSYYDAVIFDSVVNDENLTDYLGTPEFTSRVLYEILSTIAAQTRLVVLGFSNERYLHAPSALYETRRALTAACGGQFIGLQELLRDFGAQLRGPDQPLFLGGGVHPALAVQRVLGEAIGHALAAQLGDLGPAATPSFATAFITEDPPATALPAQIITRSSHFASGRFLAVPPGGEVAFSAAAGLCLGFYISVNDTRTAVCLHGETGQRWKELWYEPEKSSFLRKFVPVTNGFALNRLTALAPDETPAGDMERSPYSQYAGTLAGETRLALGRVLFWTGDPTAPVPAAGDPAPALALHEHVRAALAAR